MDIPRLHGSAADELDQFFTDPIVASACVDMVDGIVVGGIAHFDVVVEPSFGEGAFLRPLLAKVASPGRLRFFDIDCVDPAHKRDFIDPRSILDAIPDAIPDAITGSVLTIGNPPFGKNSSLAVKFFNRAAEFSDTIAFILPRTFRKRSVRSRLNREFVLVYEEALGRDSFVFKGTPRDVPSVFQVWSRGRFLDHIKSYPINHEGVDMPDGQDFVFCKASERPDFAIRRVGVNAGRIFTDTPAERSAQSHLFVRALEACNRVSILGALRSLDLEHAECKFDTAGCPSISKTEIYKLYNKRRRQ